VPQIARYVTLRRCVTRTEIRSLSFLTMTALADDRSGAQMGRFLNERWARALAPEREGSARVRVRRESERQEWSPPGDTRRTAMTTNQ